MWKNEMTDEVFETQEEAIDDIYENLDLCDGELFEVISDLDSMWIFEHLTPEAKAMVKDKWLDLAVEHNLTTP